MRTISAQLQAVYDAFPTRPSVFTRVEIDRSGSGDWVDMSNLYGRDWVRNVTYAEGVDTPVMTAAIELFARFDFLNLSPFISASPLNTGGVLVQAFRPVRIHTATLPMGYLPQESDYVLVFRGNVTQYALRRDSVQLQCRGEGGVLQDLFIEDVQEYGENDGSVQVEVVMQSILTDHGPSPTVTLYGPNGTSGTPFPGGDSPGWAIKRYEQQRQPVLNALKVLADQIGYSLRYRYHEGSGIDDLVLVLEEPDRSKAVSDFTLNGIISVNSLTQTLANIRNVVRVTYTEDQERTTSEDSDAASITKYGRRWMEIAEASASQIDTVGEADALRDAALGDLAEPVVQVSVTIPYFYVGQFIDLYELPADDIYFDSAQLLAPISFNHDLKAATTTIVLRGKPSSRVGSWASSQASHTLKVTGSRNLRRNLLGTLGGKVNNGAFTEWGKE